MSKKEQGFLYNDKIIYGYTPLNLDFVRPNKDCTQGCTQDWLGYVCFDCEMDQVQHKYDAIYTDDCEWIIKRGKYE